MLLPLIPFSFLGFFALCVLLHDHLPKPIHASVHVLSRYDPNVSTPLRSYDRTSTTPRLIPFPIPFPPVLPFPSVLSHHHAAIPHIYILSSVLSSASRYLPLISCIIYVSWLPNRRLIHWNWMSILPSSPRPLVCALSSILGVRASLRCIVVPTRSGPAESSRDDDVVCRLR